MSRPTYILSTQVAVQRAAGDTLRGFFLGFRPKSVFEFRANCLDITFPAAGWRKDATIQSLPCWHFPTLEGLEAAGIKRLPSYVLSNRLFCSDTAGYGARGVGDYQTK
jgi:hypothetical protein